MLWPLAASTSGSAAHRCVLGERTQIDPLPRKQITDHPTDLARSLVYVSWSDVCCYDRISQAKNYIKKRNLFLMVLGEGKPNVKVWASGQGCLVSSCGRVGEGERE